ncbi:hypothetical protein RA280_43275 [Cupriavidus sp. CV2]|uniref:hypothetical protein n=1 Tax=Cupriavidus ulmosensis TaxID=3065913 RepID=UPI00296AAE46|nr:hypothetical protein [Cupriavidus sp. CV2]MDW3688438.1 hypothetical protein [Cupriavidus sp. CV2]
MAKWRLRSLACHRWLNLGLLAICALTLSAQIAASSLDQACATCLMRRKLEARRQHALAARWNAQA